MNGVNTDDLDSREISHPQHSWETAKRCIQKACDTGEHDWVELMGFNETAYWYECRTCGIADVTAKEVGQTVETPNIDQQEKNNGGIRR